MGRKYGNRSFETSNNMINLDTTIIAALIAGLGYPLYVLLNAKKAIRYIKEHPDKLISSYRITGILLITMSLIVLGSMAIEKIDFSSIGLAFVYTPIWVVALFAICIIFFLLIQKMKVDESKMESLSKSFEGVDHFMPKTAQEFKWTVVLSFVAGITEEIIFRGFLFWQINQYIHWIGAILLVNFFFGIGHATTGYNNAIKAFGLGLFFSVTYVLTDSLWLAILTHIMVDLYSMTLAIKFSNLKSSNSLA